MSVSQIPQIDRLIVDARINTTAAGLVGMAITGTVKGQGFGCRVEACHTEDPNKLVLEISLRNVSGHKVQDLVFDGESKSWKMRLTNHSHPVVEQLQFYHRGC